MERITCALEFIGRLKIWTGVSDGGRGQESDSFKEEVPLRGDIGLNRNLPGEGFEGERERAYKRPVGKKTWLVERTESIFLLLEQKIHEQVKETVWGKIET